jgi:hypothetical protein
MSTSLVWTKLQHILSLAGRIQQESAKTRRTAQPPYRIFPVLRYFAQRRVLQFHDCAHGDGLRCRQECHGFRFPGFRMMTVPWIVLTLPMSTSRNLRSATYTFFGWAKIRRNQRKLRGHQCNDRTICDIDNPDISLADVSLTSMTVHMETVYATIKIDLLMFPGTRTVPWTVRMLRMSSRDWTRRQHILSLWAESRRSNGNSTVAVHQQSIPDSPIFRSTTCLYFHDCAWKRSTPPTRMSRFDVSWIPHDGAMDSSDASMSTSRDWTKLTYFLWLGEKFRRNQRSAE